MILAGNEFNFFDGRSTYTRGLGIAEVEQGRTDTFWLNTQQKGSKVNFVEQRDYNGQFVIENRENQNPSFSNDYVWVNFSVASPLLLDKEVYVVGEFNQWQLSAGQYQVEDLLYGATNTLTVRDDKTTSIDVKLAPLASFVFQLQVAK